MKISSYLKVICFVVVHVQSPVQLAVPGDGQLLRAGDPIVDGLPGVLLHLNVVEFPEVAEPLNELGGNTSVELSNSNVDRNKNSTVSFVF